MGEWSTGLLLYRDGGQVDEKCGADALGAVNLNVAAMFLHDVHPRLMWSLVGMTLGGAWWVTGRRPAAMAVSHRRVGGFLACASP